MKTNVPAKNTNVTHEGGRAAPAQSPLVELRRCVVNCLLFEDTFYEKGSDIAQRIWDLVGQVSPQEAIDLAWYARKKLFLRHVTLWLMLAVLFHHRKTYKLPYRTPLWETLGNFIQRADELTEILAMYWRDGKKPLPSQLKRALEQAIKKFDSYKLAKYNRDGVVKIRDVIRMIHPKPDNQEQAALWKKVLEGTLEPPDTWEVALSAGADKKATWERLLREEKLGALALLRNLRNMTEVQADPSLVAEAINKANPWGILPHQYLAAFKYAPAYSVPLDAMMKRGQPDMLVKLKGLTLVVVDVSGSMIDPMSGKSKMSRMDAACSLAIQLVGASELAWVFTFSHQLVSVPAVYSLATANAISESQPHGGTYLAQALMALHSQTPTTPVERIVVITDEQAHDGIIPCWGNHGYIVNIAPYQPGLDTSGGWVRINGFSERIGEWIQAHESEGVLDA